MPQEYKPAPEVQEIAERYIEEHHQHLQGVKIEYIFMSEAPTVAGKIAGGVAKKITGLNAWLSTPTEGREPEPEPYFVLGIAESIWKLLTPEQREALVDHELCHMGYDDEKDTIKIIPHDVEEFSGVVQRHGVWEPNLERLLQAAQNSERHPLFNIDKDHSGDGMRPA